MANTKSSKKSLKQHIKRNVVNVARKSMVKTSIKKVHIAIEAGKSVEEVDALFSNAASLIARAGGKGVMHKNAVARKTSRLALKVNAAKAKAA